MRKLKEDKKRMREMIAQDLPGKARYPIFSAITGLCCTMGIDETDVVVEEGAGVIASMETTHTTYAGKGANMDGPKSFVDLEANLLKISRSSSCDRRKKNARSGSNITEQDIDGLTSKFTYDNTKAEGKTFVALHQPKEEVVDLNDVSSISDKSANDESGSLSADEDVVLSDESEYSCEDSYASESSSLEPSDDEDVVYTISSDDHERSDGSGIHDGSEEH